MQSLISFHKFRSFNNFFAGVGMLAACFALATSILAAPGNLDRSFAAGGKYVVPSGVVEKLFDAVAQPDGKLVAVGYTTNADNTSDTFVVRLNENGAPDPTFGSNGRAVFSAGDRGESPTAVNLQPDGKILIAGWVQAPNNYGDFFVARLNPNGSPDASFGTGGVVVIAPTATTDIAAAVAVQNIAGESRIVVAGNCGTADTGFGFARLLPNGQPDVTFGDGGTGIKLVSVGGYLDNLQDMAIDDQGRVVATGWSRLNLGGGSFRDDFALVRLSAGGQPDTAFSQDGKVVTNTVTLGQARSIAIQKIGGVDKYLVGGFIYSASAAHFGMMRYNADGSMDATFGASGRLVTAIAQEDQIYELLPLADGRFYAVGWTSVGANRNFVVTRYLASGVRDKTFGSCGRAITDVGGFGDISYGAALMPDGKVVAVGETGNISSTNARGGIVRYTNGGAASTFGAADFDGDGREDYAVFRPSEGVWYEQCGCAGFRAVRFGIATDKPVPADYDGDGRTDEAVFRDGEWYINRSSDGALGYARFGVAGDVPTVGDYDGDLRADVSVWRPSTGVWYVLRSSDGSFTATAFGLDGDRPVPADYDGDGATDLAVYRNGTWWMKQSSGAAGGFLAEAFGLGADLPFAGDFDGNGRADLNVFRPSDANWYQKSDANVRVTRFGLGGDRIVPGDYDEDGKTDVAVYRDGQWHVLQSSTGAYATAPFGLATDVPVNAH